MKNNKKELLGLWSEFGDVNTDVELTLDANILKLETKMENLQKAIADQSQFILHASNPFDDAFKNLKTLLPNEKYGFVEALKQELKYMYKQAYELGEQLHYLYLEKQERMRKKAIKEV